MVFVFLFLTLLSMKICGCIHVAANISQYFFKKFFWSSHHGVVERNLTSIHEDVGSIPGLIQWVKGSSVAMSCGVGCRGGSDIVLL